MNGVRVVDVFEGAGGGIVHVLEGPISAERVRGELDWERRVDHSQQHHGQHILSAAFLRTCGAQTASFHLGPEACSIDLDKPMLGDAEVRAAEALANEVIRENRPVRVGMASRDEATRMGVRKLPEGVEGPLRIVTIQDWDAQPCSGTHPLSTGFVQAVCVLDAERTRGGLRVTFVCGGRVVRELTAASKRLRDAARKLSAPPAAIGEAIAKRIEEERALRRALADRDEALAKREGLEAYDRGEENGGRRLCFFEGSPGRDLKALKLVVQQAIAAGRDAVVVAAAPVAEQGCLFVAGVSPGVAGIDLREALRVVFERSPGRGGGEPKFVQGNLSAATAAEALRLFREALAS